MLSDEEKKEYEEAKLYLTHTGLDDFNLEKHQSENRIWAIETVLNLIEKQSKEIEELKDTRSIFNMGRRSYKNEIEDKIKAKIEEYLEYDKKYKRYMKDGRECFTMEYYYAKVLQSLLEKE